MRVLAGLLLVLGIGAQSAPTAATITEPGRTLQRPLDMVLGGATDEALERTLIVVLDPAASLASAGFAATFARAVADHRQVLARTSLGLAVVGRPDVLVVEPTLAHDQVTAELERQLAQPAGEFQNVYAAVREVADRFAGSKGERTLLLVTLENGDVEDDVEQTVKALRKAKIRLEVLTSEATLADSYWAARPNQEKPRGTELTGADAAVIDLPWGFLFQASAANESTPAGYAMWGLTRLAAATGGRVFLHASSSQTAHQCTVFGTCLFCSGDHEPPDDQWNSALVAQLAPSASARDETYGELGRDPSFRAMVTAWREAAQAGLIRSEPGIRVGATSAGPERARDGHDPRLVDSANFERSAKRAEAAAAKAKAIGDDLAEELAKISPESSSPRAIAAARYTVVLMQLTRVNLLTFAAWCREDAPALFDQRAEPPLPPEVPSIGDDRRPAGVGYHTLCLCHGVRPFFAVELPGGAALRPELERLDELFTEFQQRYGKSQFGYALRRNGIARFRPEFLGVAGKPPRNRPKSSNEPVVPITPRRPERQGGSPGAPSGPTTGRGQ